MRGNRVEDYQEAMNIIKEYEDIIKTNTKNIIQGKVFRKYKENRKFKSLPEQFKITKSTVIFVINIVELFDKYPKMMTSSITLNFLKIITKTSRIFARKIKKILNKLELFS